MHIIIGEQAAVFIFSMFTIVRLEFSVGTFHSTQTVLFITIASLPIPRCQPNKHAHLFVNENIRIQPSDSTILDQQSDTHRRPRSPIR